MSDQDQFSLNEIDTSSRGDVMRIYSDHQWENALILKVMYGDRSGEFECGYGDLKG